jgi:hypothetical protein
MADQKRKSEGTICGECFPEGWPDDVESAGCPHAESWTR